MVAPLPLLIHSQTWSNDFRISLSQALQIGFLPLLMTHFSTLDLPQKEHMRLRFVSLAIIIFSA